MMLQADPVIDVSFPLQAPPGTTIPADHGFALFGAVCRHLNWVHGDGRVGIHPIPGRLVGERRLQVMPFSRLTFRAPAPLVGQLIPLGGAQLELEGTVLQVGVPTTSALLPVARLRSRIVVIKGMQDAAAFLDAARRQLAALGIQAEPSIPLRARPRPHEAGAQGSREAHVRRTLRVADKTVVGYALEVQGLTAAESLELQAHGLGGRRRFGCGIFVPAGRR